MIVFLLALFTAFGGLSVYVAHRSWRGLCAFFPNLKFWPVLLLCLILSLLMIAGFSRSLLPFSPGVKAFLGHLGTYYMGFFIFLFMFTSAFMNGKDRSLRTVYRPFDFTPWLY